MTCLHCSGPLTNKRKGAKFCSAECRYAHWACQHPRVKLAIDMAIPGTDRTVQISSGDLTAHDTAK